VTSLTTRVWAATAAAVIGLASSACAGHKSSSSPTHRAPRITTSEWTPPPATTTAPAAQSEADAVRVWYASAGTYIRALSVANQQINDAAQTTDTGQLTTACQHLQDAVGGLQNTLPSPVPELTTEIQAVITDFGNAARGCLSAVPNHDQGAIDQAAQSMTSGGKHLDAATVILGRIVNGGK
jgi:hypothetical protein